MGLFKDDFCEEVDVGPALWGVQRSFGAVFLGGVTAEGGSGR